MFTAAEVNAPVTPDTVKVTLRGAPGLSPHTFPATGASGIAPSDPGTAANVVVPAHVADGDADALGVGLGGGGVGVTDGVGEAPP